METEFSKKKIVFVSVVSLVFMFMVYRTFIKGKPRSSTNPPPAAVSSPQTQPINDSQITSKPDLKTSTALMGQLEKQPDIKFNPDIRDIFKVPVKRVEKKAKNLDVPVNLPAKPKPFTMEEKNRFYSQYKFKGSILMGTRSVAIINDTFLHVGDKIEEYRIISISEKKVTLYTNRGLLKLEIIYDDK